MGTLFPNLSFIFISGFVACIETGVKGSPSSSDSMEDSASTVSTDQDEDGYSQLSCDSWDEYIADPSTPESELNLICGDCDDTNPEIYPDATETFNWTDDDCDGAIDRVDLAEASARLIGEGAYDSSGHSVAGAGDVNGDGYSDIITGAYYYMREDGYHPGAAYLVLGPVYGTTSLSYADAKFVGEGIDDNAGYSVSGAGDVDNDDYDDLIIGANDPYEYTGAAYLILGPTNDTMSLGSSDGRFIGEETIDAAGSSVSDAGDVNGDGLGDMMIGATGAAYLLLGPSTGSMSLSAANSRFFSDIDRTNISASVSTAGDVNADGFDDVLIGSSVSSPQVEDGVVYLELGPVNSGDNYISDADIKFSLSDVDDSYDYLRYSVSTAGDMDGDGSDDVLIGSSDSVVGSTYVFLGPITGNRETFAADATLLGEDYEDHSGWAVSTAGDVNADGLDDIIIGEDNVSGDGAAYLLLSPVSGTLELSNSNAIFSDEENGIFAGPTVSEAGDVNRDGYADVLVGDYWYSTDTLGRAGATYLLLAP